MNWQAKNWTRRELARFVEIFGDEQFVLYLRVDGFGNLIARGIVLLDEEPALLGLGKIPDIEDRKRVEEVLSRGRRCEF